MHAILQVGVLVDFSMTKLKNQGLVKKFSVIFLFLPPLARPSASELSYTINFRISGDEKHRNKNVWPYTTPCRAQGKGPVAPTSLRQSISR